MNRKRIITALLLAMIVAGMSAQKAKYVFYFVGDGMGVNQVNGTEAYLAEMQGRIGIEPLCFASFPNVTLVNTTSATNGITDSAAGGTALATSHKTKNGTLGMLADLTTPVYSLADWAKTAGVKVGISTSVTLNHATPGAFYGHVANRSMTHQLCHDLIESGFDFYAGSDLVNSKDESLHPGEGDTKQLMEQAGYTICYGKESYWQNKPNRTILLQSREANERDQMSLPYAIDRQEGDMTLKDIVEAGIDALTRDYKRGFFFMVEGGKIDWACHANDFGAAVREVVDMDNAIKVAYEFYKKHPKETLIVVTADHETGGLALGTGPYEQHLKNLSYQKCSAEAFTKVLKDLRKQTDNSVSWQQARAVLAEYWGFWDKIEVNAAEEAELMKVYYDSFVVGSGKMDETLYQKDEPLTTAAKRLMAAKAMVSWASGGHSNGYVPVFAVGAGSELFHGRTEHPDTPKRIAQAAGYKIR